MDKQPLVSIIIPCYQSEKTIFTCLHSIITQQYSNIEVIIVDDGSSDDTRTIIEDMSNKYSEIKYYYKNNGGVSSARNFGIEMAKGEYFMFIDSDDYIEGSFVSNFVNYAMQNKCDLVVGKIEGQNYTKKYSRERTQLIDKDKIADKFEMLYENFFFHSPCAKLYVAQIVRNCEFPVGYRIGEDLLFNFQYFQYVNNIGFMDYSGYIYYQNLNSAVHSFCANDFQLLKYEYYESLRFAQNVIGVSSSKIIDSIFVSNVIDSLMVCTKFATHDELKKYIICLNDDYIFKKLCRKAKVRNIKRKLFQLLVNVNFYFLIALLNIILKIIKNNDS